MRREIYGDWVMRCSTHVELLRSRAFQHPARRAYTFLTNGEGEGTHLTFAELDRQARTIAAFLQESNASGERVLLLYPPGLEYLAAFFGCLYAGAIAVPAYPPRLNHNLERIEAIVSDAQPIMALSSQTLMTAAMYKQFALSSHLGNLCIETTDLLPDSLADQWREPMLGGDTLAFLQYTSGSTGKPKGVMISHRNLLYNHRLLQEAAQHPDEAPYVSWLPLFHDMGLIGKALQSIYRGVPCIFMSPFAFLQKPFRWLQAISQYKAYSSYAPNFAYDLCIQKITPEQCATLDLSYWHFAGNAAEPIRSTTLERFVETFAPYGFRREAFFPGYGLAEATLLVSIRDLAGKTVVQTVRGDVLEQHMAVAAANEEKHSRSIVSCGHTWLEQKIIIVDPDTSIECPSGRVGEIWISGPSVAQGYWKRPQETREVFQARLANTGEGPFLRTGDLGFITNGELFITGRLKDLIIIRGRNYYPQDIELIATQSHPALRSNCSAVFSLDVAGEERVLLVQEVERQYIHQDLRDVLTAIRQAVLEEHELHIYGIVLIKPGSIPKTSSGKIQHRACREALLAQNVPIVFADLPKPITNLIKQSVAEITENISIVQTTQIETQPLNGAQKKSVSLFDDANVLTSRSAASEIVLTSSEHKNMQFSLLYFSSNETEFVGNKYELFLEGSRFADQHGFTAIWIPERHFHPFGGLYPNPSVLAGALAIATNRIRLRAGSVVLPMHHPARVAEEWSVIDNLSSGRIDIAFATGWNPNDFVLAPENYANRKNLLFSGIETFKKLWRGDSVTLPNGLGGQAEIKIYPRPMQRELIPWITCTGNPERFIEAGSMGANVLTGLLFQSVEELAEKIKLYREARARNGHNPASGHVTLMLHTFVGEDIEEVRRKVQGPFTAYLESSVDLWQQGSKKLESLAPQERKNVLSYAFERYFHTHALFGTPQACEKIIKRLGEIGVDEIASLIDFGMDIDTVMDGLHWLNVLRKRCQGGTSKRESPSGAAYKDWMGEAPNRETESNIRVEKDHQQWPAFPPQSPVVSEEPATVHNSTTLTITSESEPDRKINTNGRQDTDFAHQLLATTRNQRSKLLQSYLQQQIAEVLERSVEEIAGITNIRGLGLDSLGIMSIINHCQSDLQIVLDAGQFYEHTSIDSLSQYIAEEFDRVHTHERSGEPARDTRPVLQHRERQMLFPQSFAQQRIWFVSQLQPDTVAYNVSTAISIKGHLEIVTLERSLKEIVRRHEILRTTFDIREGQLVQIISADATSSLPRVDLSMFSPQTRSLEVEKLVYQEAQRPFDLIHGPLIRTTLLLLDATEYVLLFTYHHIVADGWAWGILMEELQTLYASFVAGLASPLKELPIQYADFALWQMEWLQSPAITREHPIITTQDDQEHNKEQTLLERHLAYWTKQLAGPLPVLELPTDHPRPPIQTFRGAHQAIYLPERLMESLKELSKREGTTLFMTLLASFQVLLARYSGQEDILVGTPIAGRNRAEIEPLVGFFVNALALRADLSGNPSFHEVLQRTRDVCLEAYAHQEAPFEQIVKALHLERDLSRPPLFQVMFGLHEGSWWFEAEVAGLSLRQLEIESGISAFDLTWSMTNEGFGVVEYNTDLFEASTITRLLGYWYELLASIVADPQQCIANIPLLPYAERQQLLVNWNDTQKKYSDNACMHELFEEQARLAPTAIAIMTPTVSLTYQEVEWQANQLARTLSRLGVDVGVRVGVCMERVPEAIIGLLGILKAGGIYVPLDPHYPRERLAFMTEDAQISVLLIQESVQHYLPEQRLPTLYLEPDWFRETQEPTEPLAKKSTPEQLAYVVYTSGSTGRPKGVEVSHRGIKNLVEVQKQIFELRPDDHILQFSSMSFDASIWEVCMSLCTGATLCLGPENLLLAGQSLKEILERLAITIVTLPPSVLSSLSTEGVQRVRTIIVAGEACPPGLAERWAAGRRFFNAYGPTEATVCATIQQCSDDTQRPAIGLPIANSQVYILDAYLQPVPIGVPGELYIGGIGLAYGYLNQPGLTAERFVPHPFSEQKGMRLYKTGDLGRYRADGTIEFLGRIDHQVKIRGYRIEPGEIETVLLQHPSIRECVVVVWDTPSGDKSLTAYVISREGDSISSENLRAYLQQRLPEYMVPAAIVSLDQFPLTPNGKIDRARLPNAETVRQWREPTLIPPSTALEQTIAAIWQECLHVEKVGCYENFFELGGHSLLIVQVLQKLQSQFQCDIALTDLFEYPTVSAFAQYLSQLDQPMHPAHKEANEQQAHQEEALKAGKNRLKEKRLRRVKE